MKPLLIAAVAAFGLYTGSASALSVTVNLGSTLPQTPITAGVPPTGDFEPNWGLGTDIIGNGLDPNPGGIETDNSSNASVTVAAQATRDINGWYYLDVIQDVYAFSISSVATRDNNATIVQALNLDLYEVTAQVGNNYTISLVDFATADALSIGLMAGTDYLVRTWGTLSGGASGPLGYSFDIEVRSVVPVPAAVWLFGTAIVGLFGFRRKSESAVAA